jgi:ParB/RepB/Spo0J family partition protein
MKKTTKQKVPAVQEDRFESLRIEQIIESKTNQRKDFYPEKLKELSESIKVHGIIQPLIVRKLTPNNLYELVAGARRLRAARLIKLATVPVIIRQLSDEQAQEVQIIENLQRQDIHPLDEAIGYQALLNSGKYTVEALAEKVGKSENYIYTRLRLNKLNDNFKKLFEKDIISFPVARLICRHNKELQDELYKNEFKRDEHLIKALNIIDVEDMIKEYTYKNLNALAPFELTDEKLYPQAGACSACPKNTAVGNQLFPEYSKEHLCTDNKCFEMKLKLHLETIEKKLKEKGEEVVKISTSYYSKDKNIIGSDKYNTCKKDDKGAKKALIVDANEYDSKQIGNTVYIRDTKYGYSSGSGLGSRLNPGKSLDEKRNEYRSKNNNIARIEAFKFIMVEILTELKAKKDLPEKVKKAFVKIAFTHIDHDTKCKIKNLLKWDVEKYKKNGYVDYDKFFIENFIEKANGSGSFIFRILEALLISKSLSPDIYGPYNDKFNKKSYYGDMNYDFIYELSEVLKFDYPGKLKVLNDESEKKLQEKQKAAKPKDKKKKK